jgi:hypothetical protein
MARPTYSDFKELGSVVAGLSGSVALQKLYNELEKKLLVQMYFPDRTGGRDDNIFIGKIKVRGNPDRQTGWLDVNIIIQNYLSKHDTRQTPVFFSLEDYEKAKNEGKLLHSSEIFRVLSREPRPVYFVHSEPQK